MYEITKMSQELQKSSSMSPSRIKRMNFSQLSDKWWERSKITGKMQSHCFQHTIPHLTKERASKHLSNSWTFLHVRTHILTNTCVPCWALHHSSISSPFVFTCMKCSQLQHSMFTFAYFLWTSVEDIFLEVSFPDQRVCTIHIWVTTAILLYKATVPTCASTHYDTHAHLHIQSPSSNGPLCLWPSPRWQEEKEEERKKRKY